MMIKRTFITRQRIWRVAAVFVMGVLVAGMAASPAAARPKLPKTYLMMLECDLLGGTFTAEQGPFGNVLYTCSGGDSERTCWYDEEGRFLCMTTEAPPPPSDPGSDGTWTAPPLTAPDDDGVLEAADLEVQQVVQESAPTPEAGAAQIDTKIEREE